MYSRFPSLLFRTSFPALTELENQFLKELVTIFWRKQCWFNTRKWYKREASSDEIRSLQRALVPDGSVVAIPRRRRVCHKGPRGRQQPSCVLLSSFGFILLTSPLLKGLPLIVPAHTTEVLRSVRSVHCCGYAWRANMYRWVHRAVL